MGLFLEGIKVLKFELNEISEKLPEFFRESDSLCIQVSFEFNKSSVLVIKLFLY